MFKTDTGRSVGIDLYQRRALRGRGLDWKIMHPPPLIYAKTAKTQNHVGPTSLKSWKEKNKQISPENQK